MGESKAIRGRSLLVGAGRNPELAVYFVEIPFEQQRFELVTGRGLLDIMLGETIERRLPREARLMLGTVGFEIFEDVALSRTQRCPRVLHTTGTLAQSKAVGVRSDTCSTY